MNAKQGPPRLLRIAPVLEALYARRIAVEQLIRALERYERTEDAGVSQAVLLWPKKIAS